MYALAGGGVCAFGSCLLGSEVYLHCGGYPGVVGVLVVDVYVPTFWGSLLMGVYWELLGVLVGAAGLKQCGWM